MYTGTAVTCRGRGEGGRGGRGVAGEGESRGKGGAGEGEPRGKGGRRQSLGCQSTRHDDAPGPACPHRDAVERVAKDVGRLKKSPLDRAVKALALIGVVGQRRRHLKVGVDLRADQRQVRPVREDALARDCVWGRTMRVRASLRRRPRAQRTHSGWRHPCRAWTRGRRGCPARPCSTSRAALP